MKQVKYTLGNCINKLMALRRVFLLRNGFLQKVLGLYYISMCVLGPTIHGVHHDPTNKAEDGAAASCRELGARRGPACHLRLRGSVHSSQA